MIVLMMPMLGMMGGMGGTGTMMSRVWGLGMMVLVVLAWRASDTLYQAVTNTVVSRNSALEL